MVDNWTITPLPNALKKWHCLQSDRIGATLDMPQNNSPVISWYSQLPRVRVDSGRALCGNVVANRNCVRSTHTYRTMKPKCEICHKKEAKVNIFIKPEDSPIRVGGTYRVCEDCAKKYGIRRQL